MPDELGFDIEAREAELIDGQYSDLLFRQLIEQRHRRKRVTRLLHGFIEDCTIFCRQVQEVDDLVQFLIDVGGALAGDGQVETGAVIGEQDAVAVVDQAACRRDWQYVDAVVFGDRGMVIELHHLEDVQAHDKGAADGENEQGAGDQPFVDQARLFFVVFDRDGFRHFYSNSLT
ncbi:hypothetical protein D3C81_1635430 [compost metagenome]